MLFSQKGGLRAPFVSPPRGRALPRTPSYEAGLRPPRTPRKGTLRPAWDDFKKDS